MNISNRNNLSDQKYLIDQKLHHCLESEFLIGEDRRMCINKEGIYVVMFRILNNDSNVIIYNYIYYPLMFKSCLFYYLVSKNRFKNSLLFKEWGDSLTIFDSQNNCLDNDIVLINRDKNIEDMLDNINTSDYLATNCIELFNLIYRLLYAGKYNQMSNIIDLAYTKQYISFIREIMGSVPNYNMFESKLLLQEDISKISINVLDRCLFIVQDLSLFLDLIKDKGYKVTGGPKKWMSQVNSINNYMSCLDIDFRNSLYNHNDYHVKVGNIDRRFKLGRSKFSFRNIHMNLGNIKWYSTKTTTKVSDNKKKKINLRSSDVLIARVNKSIKEESLIFDQLSDYLKSLPVNEDTQIKIEEFLYDYSYITYKNKQDKSKKSPIDYSLISNELTEFLKINEATLNNYINRCRNKTFEKEPIKQNVLVQYRLNIILSELDNSIIVSIIYGRLLRIISNFDKLNINNKVVDIALDIGNDIIRNYYYTLYYKYMLNNINILLEVINNTINSHNLKIEFDKFSLNDVKRLIRKKSDLSTILLHIKSLFYKFKNYIIKNDIVLNTEGLEKVIGYTLSDWKSDNESIMGLYNNNEIKGLMGGRIIDWMLDIGLVKIKLIIRGRKEKSNTLIPTDDVLSTLKDKNRLMHLPQRIPMIVKPKPYYKEIVDGKIKERLGGYLLNDKNHTDSLFISKWNLKESSKLEETNVVFDLVNNMNSVGYKINKDVLNFIYDYGLKYNLILDKDYQDPLLTKSKLNKSESIKLEGILSKKVLQENILGLAKVLLNIHEFYLPVRIDFRGRLNCISQYLNYQSNELAKSLLLFSKPEKIYKTDKVAIDYLKAFGANCFGNKLDKRSWNERVRWINDHINDIINFKNGKLIKQAENKLLFVAFCFEFKRWLESYNNNETTYFETYLPIQLDATCNGYQHLALLSLDYKLAKEVNLTKSTWNDNPKDFYGFVSVKLLDSVKNKLNDVGLNDDERDSYNRLSNLTIQRTIIKKSIMTKAYNVSIPQMIRYILDHFEPCDVDMSINLEDIKLDDLDNNNLSFRDVWYQSMDNNKIMLKYKDFIYLARELREVLDNDSFRLKKLLKYLNDIAKICTKLSLYIPWRAPSGAIVIQSYLSIDEVKLKPFSYNKNSFILKVPDKEKYNVSKQIRAFMPNLVHSLDAASLALLVDLYFNSITEVKNFYAVHDCFAITANNVDNIMQLLKLVYIRIYSENNYLRQLDKQMREHIKFHYGNDCFDDEKNIINIQDLPKMKFPNINAVLGTELDADFILNSSYIIM